MKDGGETDCTSAELEESAKVLPLTTALDQKSGSDDIDAIGGDAGGGLVTARGTGDGLVLRLDARATNDSLIDALKTFVSSRKSFLEGNQIALEWVAGVPQDSLVQLVSNTLKEEFNVYVASSMLWEGHKRKADTFVSKKAENLNLFSGIDSLEYSEEVDKPQMDFEGIPVASSGGSSAVDSGVGYGDSVWDDPDARVVYCTLRSGQKIETEHTLIVIGDVNSGAELVAGGDIIVLGTLRGVAHAGAYDESGGGRFIFALNLQPTQLRIGVVISRGAAQSQQTPEIARVEGNNIVVEPYSPRLATRGIVRGKITV